MKISDNLELGRAGEYLAVFWLIRQGFQAFLSDQGLPYDIVVDVKGTLLRGQVKTTTGHKDHGKSKNCLRFSTRSGKGTRRVRECGEADFYVFVSLNDALVGFLHETEMVNPSKENAFLKTTVDLRSEKQSMKGREYPGGSFRMVDRMRTIESISEFDRILTLIGHRGI